MSSKGVNVERNSGKELLRDVGARIFVMLLLSSGPEYKTNFEFAAHKFDER
jgi:hypothetical protein